MSTHDGDATEPTPAGRLTSGPTAPAPSATDLARFWDLSLAMRGVGSYDGYFTLVNAAYQELLGWSAEELMSVPYWEFIHPDDQDPLVESSQLIDGTTSSRFGYEVRMLGRDGRYRWTRWNTKTIPQEQLLYAIGIDISDARPEDERIGVGSWEWRIATDEFHWSREMLDLLAITDEPPVRYETFLQWVHDEDRQRVDRDLRLTRTYGEPYDDDFRIQRPDGSIRWLHTAGRTIPRADGQPKRVRGIATDVTERASPGRGRQN
jgi:PAS domain S-box-containing protein